MRGVNLAAEQQYHLVSAALPVAPIPQSLLDSVEPAFPVAESTDLSFPAEYQSELTGYFAHCVARDPRDLRSHVRRILLERETGNGDGLYAALIDLFIALGRQGGPLRRRMLEQSKECLESIQYQLLRGAYAEGLDAMSAPVAVGSVLGRGLEGRLDMVRPAREKPADARDVLLEAREYMEYSQLDEARALLERAALEEPERLELLLELLDIYRSTRDEANFVKMTLQLADAGIAVPDEWLELAEHFGGPDAV